MVFLGDTYFYQHSGWLSAGRITTAGELFIAEGDNDISAGISDSTGGSPPDPNIAINVTGNYDSSPHGTGSLTLLDAGGNSTFNLYVVDRNVNIFDPNASPAGILGGAGNALMLHTDARVNGTGVLIRNPTPGFAPFLGNNALQLTDAVTTPISSGESDLVGVVAAAGIAQLSGFADYDKSNPPGSRTVLGAPLTGSFIAEPSLQGRATGTITIPTPSTAGSYPFIPGAAAPGFDVTYYQINGSQTFVLQIDASGSSSGFVFQQLLP